MGRVPAITANHRTSRPLHADRSKVAVGYVRRSTERQEQSIPDQRRAIEQYCRDCSIDLLQFYIDDAISGTSTAGRRAFKSLIDDAMRPGCPFGQVVVYDVKRFGRVDNDEAGYYRHILKTHGVEVIYVSENFSGGETDDLLRPVKQWQARQESKDLSKVTIRGLLSKLQSHSESPGNSGGVWLGGVPPHGYDLRYENDRGHFLFTVRHMPDGSKQMLNAKGKVIRTLARGESVSISKRDRARLVPGDPKRIETVKLIFRMYTKEGRGLSAVADALNRRGIPTPRGPGWSHIYAGQWRDSTVRAILVNPIYVGDMVWNRRTDARFHSISDGRAVERKTPHGARLVPNPREDWIVIANAHPPLVDRRTFTLAQRVREERPASATQRGKQRATVGGWNGARARFLLSGLVRCACCGNRYQGVTRRKGRPRKDGSYIRTYYYGCGGYIAKGSSVCKLNAVPQAQLEELVCREVVRFYAKYTGDAGRQRLARAVRKQLGVEEKDLTEARRRAQRELEKIDRSIANLLDNMSPGVRDLAEKRLIDLRGKREAVQVRLDELDRLADSQDKVADVVNEVSRYIASLEYTLRHGVNEEKQLALRQAVESISLDKNASMMRLHLRSVPHVAAGGAVTVLSSQLRGLSSCR